MAKENVGCLLCLERIIPEQESSPLCFRPLSPKVDAGLILVWKKYPVFSKAAEAFLTVMQTETD